MEFLSVSLKVGLTSINEYITTIRGCSLYIKREDLLHPSISGNKYRKLKYNVLEAKETACDSLVTFGGAFSNHIAATAAAGKLEGIKTIGYIRGEELGKNFSKTVSENPTIAFAHSCGMQLYFITREAYREKDGRRFRESIKKKFPNAYIIPEGGTNELAIKGCEEILVEKDQNFNYICCAAGTGGTASGIINSLSKDQKMLVFPALKGKWMEAELQKYTINNQYIIEPNYHFGGYAKVTIPLINFINSFTKEYRIALDPIYTGKMLYGIFDKMKHQFFPENSRILAIHTGGLQGIQGMNLRLAKKGLPLIKL